MNITFQIVHFFYFLALSFFIAGSVCLGAVAAPAIFKGLSSRDKAGEIFGNILEKLFWKLNEKSSKKFLEVV